MGSSDVLTTTSVTATTATVKAAKKALKKHDSDTMKMKALTKLVLDKLGSEVGDSKKAIQKVIEDSDVFNIDGKNVSLRTSGKKRKASDSESGDNNDSSSGDDDDLKKAKKAAKRAKKEAKKKKKEASSSSSTSKETNDEDATKWRKEHKVVLRDARDDGNKALDSNAAYKPIIPLTRQDARLQFLLHCSISAHK